MKDYLSKMKGYVDMLAACGHSVTDGNQILYVFGGIGLEYDFVVVHITSHVDTVTHSEVGALILAHEMKLNLFILKAHLHIRPTL